MRFIVYQLKSDFIDFLSIDCYAQEALAVWMSGQRVRVVFRILYKCRDCFF